VRCGTTDPRCCRRICVNPMASGVGVIAYGGQRPASQSISRRARLSAYAPAKFEGGSRGQPPRLGTRVRTDSWLASREGIEHVGEPPRAGATCLSSSGRESPSEARDLSREGIELAAHRCAMRWGIGTHRPRPRRHGQDEILTRGCVRKPAPRLIRARRARANSADDSAPRGGRDQPWFRAPLVARSPMRRIERSHSSAVSSPSVALCTG
jgi:hypothetical protein